jgi:hypothetical protein
MYWSILKEKLFNENMSLFTPDPQPPSLPYLLDNMVRIKMSIVVFSREYIYIYVCDVSIISGTTNVKI